MKEIINKAIKVIDSCKTDEHILSAFNYVHLVHKKIATCSTWDYFIHYSDAGKMINDKIIKLSSQRRYERRLKNSA